MTTREALEDQPSAARGAVTIQRLQRVLRAGRMESAVHAQQGAHRIAIAEYQERQQSAHEDPTRHRSTSARATSRALSRIRMSRLPRSACRARNNSRSTRFIRLRSTARGKTRLGTMRPSLGTPNGLARTSTLNPGRLSARAPESSAAISAVPRRKLRPKRLRTLKRSSGRGPWRGAPESRPGHRACAFGREIRACASCGRLRGEKYVSWRESSIADGTLD